MNIILRGRDNASTYLRFMDREYDIELTHGLNTVDIPIEVDEGKYAEKISVIPVKDEKVLKNNYYETGFIASDRKWKTLIIYDDIDIDMRFVEIACRILGDVDVFGTDSIPDKTVSYDTVIITGLTPENSSLIRRFSEEGTLVIAALSGRSDNFDSLPYISSELKKVRQDYYIKIPEKNLNMPFFRIKENIMDNRNFWNKYILCSHIFVSEEELDGNHLITGYRNNAWLLNIREDESNIVYFLGGPLYRFALDEAVVRNTSDLRVFEQLLTSIMRFYAHNTASIVWEGLEKMYQVGDKVEISVSTDLSDDVVIFIDGKPVSRDNSYSFTPGKAGVYELKAQVRNGDEIIAENERFLEIQTNTKEAELVTENTDFLKKISHMTGGNYYRHDNVSLLRDQIENNIIKEYSFGMVNTHLFVILFLFLFSVYLYFIYR